MPTPGSRDVLFARPGASEPRLRGCTRPLRRGPDERPTPEIPSYARRPPWDRTCRSATLLTQVRPGRIASVMHHRGASSRHPATTGPAARAATIPSVVDGSPRRPPSRHGRAAHPRQTTSAHLLRRDDARRNVDRCSSHRRHADAPSPPPGPAVSARTRSVVRHRHGLVDDLPRRRPQRRCHGRCGTAGSGADTSPLANGVIAHPVVAPPTDHAEAATWQNLARQPIPATC
jgi:hypothetical protein